ncbi:phage head-tail connector protein [Bosea sp. (in: a-proteobacteria)]|uniref:head-tail connector protein n=1 Tax=Bosea sp. (in: a-proteobacteria) TaxID=1871050 RepID=UPI00261A2FCF|nr:phage head-tail connector protein [Bosea sp. (in: a-proteobacteria)]MCO5092547.1 phage head-tail connector protein [Bosea sp. (in: a-proteobacteria)]
MTPLALAPPAMEPVTLAETRQFLRLDQTDEDALLTTLITASRLMIEAQAGRCLIEQPWRIVLDRWPAAGEIRLPLSPLMRIEEARVYDVLGEAQAVAPASLTLEMAADPPLIRVTGELPEIGRSHGAIEIDIVAGYGATAAAVPAPLRQAVLRLAARWFEQRGDVAGRDGQALPAAIAALIAPFRRGRL